MRESVIYQDILQRGEVAMLLRILTRRIGRITPEIQVQLQALSIAQLEDLGEALLDFSQPSDLITWLESHQP